MTMLELFRMACQNLWQRRLRTFLNLVGIVMGCILLLLTASGTQGVRTAIFSIVDSSEFARQIQVWPNHQINSNPPESALVVEGNMSDTRRQRIKNAMAKLWKKNQATKVNSNKNIGLVTLDRLDELRSLRHVVNVMPTNTIECRVRVGQSSIKSNIAAANIASKVLHSRLLVGEMLSPTAMDEVMIDEFIAYRLGVRNDQDLRALIGQTIEIDVCPDRHVAFTSHMLGNLKIEERFDAERFEDAIRVGQKVIDELDATELADADKQLLRERFEELMQFKQTAEKISATVIDSASSNEPATLYISRRRLKVCGILSSEQEKSPLDFLNSRLGAGDGGLFVNPELAIELAADDPLFEGFWSVGLVVDSSQDLKVVTDELEKINYNGFSVLWLVQHVERQYSRSRWVLFTFAGVVLLTAGIGICNTLLISVVERTPEIGILKAIGAQDSYLLKLMLIEGAVLGLLGGIAAVVLATSIASVIQFVSKSYLDSLLDMDFTHRLFEFSPQLIGIVVLCSTGICMLASIMPAWRASRLDPVVAMRRK
ncbi:MAG TPA: FtsX-like permease family protein [Pirellulaceae bacterium]|nr:FtsX-like permease family protein [Pirellulaceae bacterium]HMP68375.1 FtsX-like permease family protein [Pirellulaceae bacterium]